MTERCTFPYCLEWGGRVECATLYGCAKIPDFETRDPKDIDDTVTIVRERVSPSDILDHLIPDERQRREQAQQQEDKL